jgi:signal transduction histidine kinase/CheY-like chemotaxis protein
VLTPQGRDASVAEKLLSEAGIRSVVCSSLRDLEQRLCDDICMVVVAEESLRSADLRTIADWLSRQPTWSDLPFIILTHRTEAVRFHPEMPRLTEILGNVTLIERPFHPLSFVSIAKTAFKGRSRQYEARARIAELREIQEGLERRVAERTVELEQAHAEVLAEIAQREKAEEKLRQAQKMEMIGQLTGGVAHDFNNLLMAVIGNLDLLRRRAPADPKLSRFIEGAIQGAQRGAALTQRLLAFARRQDLKTQPVDLSQLIFGMKDLLERSIGTQIELVVNASSNLPLVLIDANQVELAVLNLVVNARDAMPDGGRLSIEIDRVISSDPSDGGGTTFVRLSVIDTGTGMDEETLQKATEPFFSTKELGKGTGLGLSMIHGLMRQLGGTLKLTSLLGQGTRAELWLPTTTKELSISDDARQEPTPSPQEKIKVLIVDDDALILTSTAAMIEDLGHEVFEATSGTEAVAMLRSGEHIDLLITDFSMPRMNGAQLALEAKEIAPHLPVLMATGYAELPVGSELGYPRLAKPFQQEQLAAAISQVLRSAAN